jgi:hypothetical protein
MPSSSNPDELYIQLYLDRHVKPLLAGDLRQRGFDVLTTQEAEMDTDRSHAGIIVSQQLSRQYGVLLNRTLRLLDTMTAEELRNNLVHLERFRT